MKPSEVFETYIHSGKPFCVKLLGDSITHGVGGAGFAQNGAPITGDFSRSPYGHCWANRFRDYMEAKYNCTVINNACTGTDIEFVIRNFERLVDADDDIVICTIGTNNRHQYMKNTPKHTKQEHMGAFYENILTLSGLFKKAGKNVIFCANIPASKENEADGSDFWRIFHMNDVNDLYEKASSECGFSFFSMYHAFLAYCDEKSIFFETLLKDGLHPNDEGYDVMLELWKRELHV